MLLKSILHQFAMSFLSRCGCRHCFKPVKAPLQATRCSQGYHHGYGRSSLSMDGLYTQVMGLLLQEEHLKLQGSVSSKFQ